jgi:UDP-N-acetylmuramate--alanine ligase
MQMTYPGIHNIENAVLALSIALSLGVNEYELRAALKSFKGMKRRFDLKCKTDETIYYDDYAHHPEEIEATITSLKHLYPNKRICGIFQPHLYSRTKDFADQFAEALENLDDIILLPIYPAREEAIPGITSKTILHKINKMDKYHVTKEQLFPLLSALQPELLVTLGAGDIDQLVEPIIQLLKEDE